MKDFFGYLLKEFQIEVQNNIFCKSFYDQDVFGFYSLVKYNYLFLRNLKSFDSVLLFLNLKDEEGYFY